VSWLNGQVFHLSAVFPVLVLDTQAKVNNGLGWASGDTGSTVNVDLLFLIVDKVEECLGTLEETVHVVSLVEIVERIENYSVDSGMSVHHFDLGLIHSSLLDLSWCLENQNSIAAFSGDLININLINWIWSKHKVLLWDFMSEKAAHEISISLVEDIIDDEISLLLTLLICAFVSLGTLVKVWVCDLEDSLWFSLSNLSSLVSDVLVIVVIYDVVCSGKLSIYLLERIINFNHYLVWSHLLAIFVVHPVLWLS